MRILHTAPPVISISELMEYAGTERIVFWLNQIYHLMGHKSFVVASGDSDLGPYGKLIPTISKCLWKTEGVERKTISSDEVYEEHYRKGLEFALENNIEIIHDHPGKYLVASKEYNKQKIDIPIVTTIHGAVSDDEREEYSKFIKLQKENKQVYFVSISESQKQKYEEMGIQIDEVIYNGIPPQDFQFKEKKQDYLLWLGRLCSMKGTDLAVKVAKETGRPLIIAGEVHTQNEDFYREKIKPSLTYSISDEAPEYQKTRREDLVERLNNGEQIVKEGQIIFIGPVNKYQKSILYSNASALIQANRWREPFGLTMAESSLAGTPVVGTNIGSIPELIKHGKTGYVIDPLWIDKRNMRFNETHIVKELAYALNYIGKINPFDCRKDAEERFSQEVMGKNYIKFYEKVLSNSSK